MASVHHISRLLSRRSLSAQTFIFLTLFSTHTPPHTVAERWKQHLLMREKKERQEIL